MRMELVRLQRFRRHGCKGASGKREKPYKGLQGAYKGTLADHKIFTHIIRPIRLLTFSWWGWSGWNHDGTWGDRWMGFMPRERDVRNNFEISCGYKNCELKPDKWMKPFCPLSARMPTTCLSAQLVTTPDSQVGSWVANSGGSFGGFPCLGKFPKWENRQKWSNITKKGKQPEMLKYYPKRKMAKNDQILSEMMKILPKMGISQKWRRITKNRKF